MTTLQDKTALVTGASRGIGRATALALARAGANVLVRYGRSVQDAESLVDAIRAQRGSADAVQADLGLPDGAPLLAKQVRAIAGGRLDVLVLNAGVSKAARIADYTVEEFDNLFSTNVRGPFRRGVILYNTSVLAFVPLAVTAVLHGLSPPSRWQRASLIESRGAATLRERVS